MLSDYNTDIDLIFPANLYGGKFTKFNDPNSTHVTAYSAETPALTSYHNTVAQSNPTTTVYQNSDEVISNGSTLYNTSDYHLGSTSGAPVHINNSSKNNNSFKNFHFQ